MTSENLYQKNLVRSASHVAFGDVVYPPGGVCGPRVQRNYQIVVVHAGEARVTVDAAEIGIPAQHAALFLPGPRELFVFAPAQETRHTYCEIAPSAVPAALQTRLGAAPRCQPLTPRMAELVNLGLATPAGYLAAADAFLLSIGLALLQAFLFDADYTQLRHHVPEAVLRAQQHIGAHLGEPLDLAQIAAAATVTPQYLTRLFQRHLRTTPARYLWRRRTERGVELLRETGLSVGTIAERTGFQSPFHFSRLVRQHYGLSPRALRAQFWSGGAHQ